MAGNFHSAIAQRNSRWDSSMTEPGPGWQVGPQQFTEDYITLAPKIRTEGRPALGGRFVMPTTSRAGGVLALFDGDFRAQVHASSFRRSTPIPILSLLRGGLRRSHNREIDRFVSVDLAQRIPYRRALECRPRLRRSVRLPGFIARARPMIARRTS